MIDHLNFSIGVAYRAGSLLLGMQDKVNSRAKNQFNDIGSIVTEADVLSEKLIRQAISGAFPDHNFCGEESGLINNGSSFTWYVDPLDGTYNYVRNYPMWGVSIGLALDQRPVMGVLYFPVLRKLYYGSQGHGAFCNEQNISVSANEYEKSCYSIPTFRYQGQNQVSHHVVEEVQSSKIHHCSTFDFACLAEGNTEIVISGTLGPWDACAGVSIVREAGGVVTDHANSEWVMSSEYLIATNNRFHERLVEIVAASKIQSLDRLHLIPEAHADVRNTKIPKLNH